MTTSELPEATGTENGSAGLYDADSTLLGSAVTGMANLLAQLPTHGHGMKTFFWILMATDSTRPANATCRKPLIIPFWR